MEPSKQRELEHFTNNEIYENQTYLVEELFKKEVFDWGDITNVSKTDAKLKDEGYTAEDIKEGRVSNPDNEILEWYSVSDWMTNQLKAKNEPILQNDFGNWWGRTCTGQAIVLDGVIKRIYDNPE